MNAVEAERLVEAYLPLALSIANRWGERWPWLRDDFRSAAAWALWRSALAFDRSIGKFPAYVHVAVRRHCFQRLRREHRTAPEAFRAPPPADPDLDPAKLLAAGDPHAADRLDAADEVEKLLDVLTPTQAAAVESHFIAEHTVAEIAAENGTTWEAVRDAIRRGLERMRRKKLQGMSNCSQ